MTENCVLQQTSWQHIRSHRTRQEVFCLCVLYEAYGKQNTLCIYHMQQQILECPLAFGVSMVFFCFRQAAIKLFDH